MAIQLINIGALPNDGTGDPLRVAFEKINNNFIAQANTTAAAGPDSSIQYRATNTLKTVAYRTNAGTGIYVLAGAPNRWYTSPDAVQWTAVTPPTSRNINQIIGTSAGFLAVGDNGTALSSLDAVTWITLTTGTTQNLNSIDYNSTAGLFTIVGAAGTILTSPDAATWTVRGAGLTTATLYGVVSQQNQWAAVGSAGTAIYSANGTSWALGASLGADDLNSVAIENTAFYAVGNSGKVYTSTNGVAWNLRTTGITNNLYSVTGANLANVSTVIAVGSNGKILKTINTGANWTIATVGTATFNDVTYANSAVLAVGNNGNIYSSVDATTWVDLSIPGSLEGSANFVYDPSTGLSIAGNIVPQTNNAYTLGTANNRWSTGYFAPDSVYIGAVALKSNALELRISDGGNVLANITGNAATFSNVNANYGNFANLAPVDTFSANNFTANVLAANTGNITSLVSVNIQSNSAVVSNTLSATNVVASTATVGNLGVTTNLLVGNNITSNTLTTGNTTVGNLTVSGAFNFPSGNLAVNNLAANTIAGSLTTATQPNITRVGTLTDLTVSNTIVGNITGSASSANFTQYTEEANTSNTVIQALQPNITSVGTLTSLNVAGNANIQGNALLINVNIVDGNITGTLTGTFAGNLTGNATNSFQSQQSVRANVVVDSNQPNITGLGTLANLTVAGNTTLANVSIGNANVTGTLGAQNINVLSNVNTAFLNATVVTATTLKGEGGNISNIQGANVTGSVPVANTAATAGTVTTAAQPNITSVGTLTGLTVSGNVTATAATIGNVTGNNAVFANVTGTLTTAAQPNITSVGTLTSLAVTGNVTAGNISVTGSTVLANVTAGNLSVGSTLTAVQLNTDEITANTINGNLVIAGAPTGVLFSKYDSVLGANTIDANANQLSWNGNTLTANGNVVANYYTGIITAASSNQSNITVLGNLRDLQIGFPGTGNGSDAYSGILRVYGGITPNVEYSAEFSGGKIFASDGAVVAGDFAVRGGNTYWEGPVNVSFDLANASSRFSIGGNQTTLQGSGAGGLLDIGTGANGSNLTGYVAGDRGLVTHYYANGSGDQSAALIWKTANNQFEVYRTSTRSAGFVSAVDYGNVKANWFFGKFSGEISNGTGNFDTLNVGNLNVSIDTNMNGVVNISNVSNINLPGGAEGQVLVSNGSGGLRYSNAGIISNGTSNVNINGSGGTVGISVNGQGNIIVVNSNGTHAQTTITNDVAIGGNLVVLGNTTYSNVSELTISDPIIDLGTGPNGAPLSSNDPRDRGMVLHFYGGNGAAGPDDLKFMGYDQANAAFAVASNVSVANSDVTINQLGNFRASNIFGDGNLSVTGNATITENLIAGNANLGNLATANFFSGNGSALSAITGANVTGTVANAGFATVAATATTANSVAGANVSGQVSFAATANSVAGANVSGFVANANVANTALAVAGANVSGAVAFATTANSVAGANVSGEVSFAAVANAVAGANVSGTVANASFATLAATANSVAGANVTGFVANANVANTAYSVAVANVVGIGNIATTNYNGNGQTFLSGNGLWANIPVQPTENLQQTLTSGNTANIGITLTDGAGLTANGNITGNVLTVNTISNIAVANVKITGGSNLQFLQTDGNGNLSFANVANNTTSFSWGDTSPKSLLTVPAGSVVTEVSIIITTAFDAVSSLTVGDSGNTSRLMEATDSITTVSGTYSVEPGYLYTTQTPLTLSINPGASQSGSGFVVITYK